MTTDLAQVPVRKTIVVHATASDAFHVFTAEIDTWWPKTHHIGSAQMLRAVIEGRVGGRCYTEQTDATESDWGTVLVWDPPRRFVLAWQVAHDWRYEPDPAKASEVEVVFTPVGATATRVDLEHRHLDRHGPVSPAMRAALDSPNGWAGLLRLYAGRVETRNAPLDSTPSTPEVRS